VDEAGGAVRLEEDCHAADYGVGLGRDDERPRAIEPQRLGVGLSENRPIGCGKAPVPVFVPDKE